MVTGQIHTNQSQIYTQPCQKSSQFSLLIPLPTCYYHLTPHLSLKPWIPSSLWSSADKHSSCFIKNIRHTMPRPSYFSHQCSICNSFLLFPPITQRKCLFLNQSYICTYLPWAEHSFHSGHYFTPKLLIMAFSEWSWVSLFCFFPCEYLYYKSY